MSTQQAAAMVATPLAAASQVADTREGAPAGAAATVHTDALSSGAALRKDAGPAAPVRREEVRGVRALPDPDRRPHFFLKSADGQFLHLNGQVLTRLPRFYWSGTTDEIVLLKTREPKWRGLSSVALP